MLRRMAGLPSTDSTEDATIPEGGATDAQGPRSETELAPTGQTSGGIPLLRAVERGHSVEPLRPARHQYARMYRLVAASDAVALAAGLLLAHWIGRGDTSLTAQEIASLGLVVALVPLVFSAFGLYRAHLFTSAEEFRRLIRAVTVVVVALAATPVWAEPFRLRIGLFWAAALTLALLARREWHAYIRRARASGGLTALTAVVGVNDEAIRLAEVLGEHPSGFRPIGFVATRPVERSPDGLALLGELTELEEILLVTGAECVFVASSSVTVKEMRSISTTVRRLGRELRVTANLPEVLSHRVSLQSLGGVMALSIRPVRLSRSQVLAKRAFDLGVSIFGLMLSSPAFLVIAILIKLSSRGPVFYRQERVGQQGRPFTFLKFRTMVLGADKMLESLKPLNEASGPLFKIRRDPRITPVGRWLRRWSLDELPQLIDVLRGDMSLVGPRPALPDEVRRYRDWHFDRLEVRPGITGIWQVNGRSDLSFDEGVRMDLFYIENWSLSYDVFILLKTVPAVVFSRGAY